MKVIPVAVALSLLLSGCGQTAEQRALQNCLDGMKQVAIDEAVTDTDELIAMSDICQDLYDNHADELVERFGD